MTPVPEDTLLKSIACLNPKGQNTHDSVQHCKVIACQISSVQSKKKLFLEINGYNTKK